MLANPSASRGVKPPPITPRPPEMTSIIRGAERSSPSNTIAKPEVQILQSLTKHFPCVTEQFLMIDGAGKRIGVERHEERGAVSRRSRRTTAQTYSEQYNHQAQNNHGDVAPFYASRPGSQGTAFLIGSRDAHQLTQLRLSFLELRGRQATWRGWWSRGDSNP